MTKPLPCSFRLASEMTTGGADAGASHRFGLLGERQRTQERQRQREEQEEGRQALLSSPTFAHPGGLRR